MANNKSNEPIYFKAYAGSKEVRDEVKKWLSSPQFQNLTVTGGWDPEEEWGSWGVVFSYLDESIIKTIKKEWGKRGVAVERGDIGIS